MSSPEGAPVLVPKGNHHQDVNDWIEAGREVALEWSQPDTNLVYLALLKQFYLAICLRFGSRTVLSALRRVMTCSQLGILPAGTRFRSAPWPSHCPLRRGQPIAGAPAVAEAVEHHPDGDRLAVVLAGSIFIPWVVTPVALAPIADRQVKVTIRFGPGTSAGTVANVELSPRRTPYPDGRHD